MPKGLEQSAYMIDNNLILHAAGTPLTGAGTTTGSTALESGFIKGEIYKAVINAASIDDDDGDETYKIRILGRDEDTDDWETLGIQEIACEGSPLAITELNYEFSFKAARNQINWSCERAGTSPSIDFRLYLHPEPC
ncbi:MAG: hypothetical protein PHP92_05505 [Candidatus Nanoarchaeia archaeon]|nr:hypothetical protein [Candidatus Nanoarchaeia archaeon]